MATGAYFLLAILNKILLWGEANFLLFYCILQSHQVFNQFLLLFHGKRVQKGIVSWLGKTAKVIIYIYFSFSFLLDLLHRKKYKKVSCHKCYTVTVTWQKVTVSHHMMSHNKCGKVVHRPCSSYISSVQKITETLLSFLCQLRLGGWLSHPG